MVNGLDYKGIKFLFLEKIIVELSKKTKFALMCFVMKIIWFILFICQIKDLNIIWIYC